MSPAPHPRMHGLTHVPGGPDPIPGLLTNRPTGQYVDQILNHPDLVHYWRMGAASGNQPDTSPHLGGPVDMTPQVAGAAGTYNVTGALSATEDDGAYQTAAGGASVTDTFVTGSTHRANFAGNTPLTIEVWAWINSSWTTGFGGIVSMGSSGSLGWVLMVVPDDTPARTLRFQRGTTGASSTLGITADEWHHLAVTYDGATTRIYVDGTLWFSEANAASIPTISQPVRAGRYHNALTTQYFWGKLDEIALYTAELSAAEIATHYEAGAALTGTGTLGEILSSDGAGGVFWLPNGTEGQILTITGGIPTWEDP